LTRWFNGPDDSFILKISGKLQIQILPITILLLVSQLPGGNVIKLRVWDSASEIIATEKEIIA